jgi:hypothetical protein
MILNIERAELVWNIMSLCVYGKEICKEIGKKRKKLGKKEGCWLGYMVGCCSSIYGQD